MNNEFKPADLSEKKDNIMESESASRVTHPTGERVTNLEQTHPSQMTGRAPITSGDGIGSRSDRGNGRDHLVLHSSELTDDQETIKLRDGQSPTLCAQELPVSLTPKVSLMCLALLAAY